MFVEEAWNIVEDWNATMDFLLAAALRDDAIQKLIKPYGRHIYVNVQLFTISFLMWLRHIQISIYQCLEKADNDPDIQQDVYDRFETERHILNQLDTHITEIINCMGISPGDANRYQERYSRANSSNNPFDGTSLFAQSRLEYARDLFARHEIAQTRLIMLLRRRF